MFSYDIIDITEEIDPTKSNKSRECMICHYWFYNLAFKFQYSLCNGGHGFSMLCRNISDIVIITLKNIDYHCIVHNIRNIKQLNY